jgi:Outer membrane protein beta-barrel domain
MRWIVTSLVGTAALLVCLMQVAVAQDRARQDQGPWFGIGVGYSMADFDCSNCGRTGREDNIGGQIAAGGTLSDHLLLGIEGDGWIKTTSGVRSEFAAVTAAAYFYPSVSANFFLKAGAGLAHYSFSNGSPESDTGLGLMGGAGFDLPIGGTLLITPVATFNYGSMGDQSGARDVTINWVTLGATFTLR